jgi:hypothetical protein
MTKGLQTYEKMLAQELRACRLNLAQVRQALHVEIQRQLRLERARKQLEEREYQRRKSGVFQVASFAEEKQRVLLERALEATALRVDGQRTAENKALQKVQQAHARLSGVQRLRGRRRDQQRKEDLARSQIQLEEIYRQAKQAVLLERTRP